MNKNFTYAFVLLALSLLIVLPVIDFVNVTCKRQHRHEFCAPRDRFPHAATDSDALNQPTLIARFPHAATDS